MVTREQYETLSKNYLELKEKYAKLKENAIIISENATNGDMIKALFPNIKWWINTDRQIFAESGTLNLDWWNKPYKKGVDK